MVEQVLISWRKCSLWVVHIGAGLFRRTAAYGKDLYWSTGKNVRWKELQRGTAMGWPQPLILNLSYLTWREELKDLGMKTEGEMGRKRGKGWSCFNLSLFLTIQIYFHCHYIKITFSIIKSVLPVTVSHKPYSNLWAFSIYFLPSALLR